MKRRVATAAATVAVAVVALVLVAVGVISLVVAPSQLLCSVLLGAIAGCGVHLRNLERAGSRSTSPVLCDSVVLAGLATVVVWAVGTGLVFVLGTVSGPVIIMLVLSGSLWSWRRARRSLRPAAVVLDEEVPVAAVDLSVAELCLAWRHSYLALTETPFGAGRDEVVNRRRELLDELEQRDHAGFGRWIGTGARAASDPGRFLSTDR